MCMRNVCLVSYNELSIVKCILLQKWIRVEVSDTGMGIAPEMLPHLFRAFEQDKASRAFGGLGLGLFISKGMCVLCVGYSVARVCVRACVHA